MNTPSPATWINCKSITNNVNGYLYKRHVRRDPSKLASMWLYHHVQKKKTLPHLLTTRSYSHSLNEQNWVTKHIAILQDDQYHILENTSSCNSVLITLSDRIKLDYQLQPYDTWKFQTTGCGHEIVCAGQELKYPKYRKRRTLDNKVHRRLSARLPKRASMKTSIVSSFVQTHICFYNSGQSINRTVLETGILNITNHIWMVTGSFVC